MKMRKCLSLLLALTMVLGMLPPPAFAAEIQEPTETLTEETAKHAVKTVTVWGWNDEYEIIVDGSIGLIWDSVAWADLVPMLPGITATLGAETENLALTWSCADVADGMLTAGTHTLTAALPEGYALGENVPGLTLTLEMGGGSTLEDTGDFTVTGGTLGTDYTYADHTLTILTGTPMTISGSTTADHIVVDSGVAANITLSNVNINVSETSGACAFAVFGSATITLADGSSNILKSGQQKPGLSVLSNASVTIQGSTGSLSATGGDYGAGIGSGNGEAAGLIVINGGTITVQGGWCASGIGGGGFGTGGTLIFNGGTVSAIENGQYVYGGAAFGTGTAGSSGGAIIVTGGTMSGSDNAAGKIVPSKDNTNNLHLSGNLELRVDFTIPEGKTLTIPAGSSLTIPSGVTLTNNGSIQNSGEMTNNGELRNNGTFDNDGILTNSGTVSGNGSIDNNGGTVYSKGEISQVTGGGNYHTSMVIMVNGGAYTQEGDVFTVTANQPETGKKFANWDVSRGQANWLESYSNTSNPAQFTTSSLAITLTANYTDVAAVLTDGNGNASQLSESELDQWILNTTDASGVTVQLQTNISVEKIPQGISKRQIS